MDYEKKVLKTRVENDGVDRISGLPNSLLCHILSLLPTKESAATSILSKKWKYLFALVPDIDLEYTHFPPPNDGNDGEVTDKEAPDKPFLDFIKLCNRMTLLRNGAAIRKFKLFLRGIGERCHLILESMISGALMCQIQEIEVVIDHIKYSVRDCPPGIFTCETLVALKLSWRRSMNPGLPNTVCLPNLQVLRLDFMLSADECSIQRLIQGCPKLEELFLMFTCSRNHGIDKKKKHDVVDFSSPSIKRLTLDFWGGDEKATRIIVGSHNLESLEYRLHGESDAQVIVNAPNLKHLAGQASAAKQTNFVDSLNCLVTAKIPVDAGWFFEVFGEAEIEHHLHRVQNVESLSLGEHILQVDWKKSRECGYEGVESVVEDVFPTGLIEKLKEIEIRGCDNEEYELKVVVEHLVRNGKALKKMSINGTGTYPASCSRI